ncbi:MAG: hypothetical protein H6628_19740 [Calditrichae bacterium]|nr:hypothetical protein [Calditrichia bacterium]
MAKVLINFANGFFAKSQQLNTRTALEVGGFDKALSYTPKDIDRVFYQDNRRILSRSKGAGYWLWKPYFIRHTLDTLREDDFLFYCDAGAYFIDSIDGLVDTARNRSQDIIPFDVGFIEKSYTKRDAFRLMGCDTLAYTDTAQRLASFILFRNTRFTRDFVAEFLDFARDERILTDRENELGYPNYPGFVAHRHDQSIFSLLTKRHRLLAHRDPSQWGNGGEANYPHSQYGQLIEHTRNRNLSVWLKIRELSQAVFSFPQSGIDKPDGDG